MKLLSTALFLGLFYLGNNCIAEEPEELDIAQTLHADLTRDGHDETILVAHRRSDTMEAPSLIIKDGDQVLMTASKALPRIKSIYSPAIFNGFEVAVATSQKNTTSVIDIQGEATEVLYPSMAGAHLILRTVEEGSSQHSLNLHFAHEASTKNMVLRVIILSTNNAYCDQSLKSVHVFPKHQLLSTSLGNFDGFAAFQELKALHHKFQYGEVEGLKVMPSDISKHFDQALSAYQEKNNKVLKETMTTFIEGGGSNDTCPAEHYIAEKYYFPSNPRWSNDLGFLFEQAGYFDEAIELLQKVTAMNPQRTVAYLNLADSYWGANSTDQAAAMYQKYYSLMSRQGKLDKIPKRVFERLAQ